MGLYYPKVREPWYRGETRFGVGPDEAERFVDLPAFRSPQEKYNLLPDVFISHKSQDLMPARRAAEILQDAGVSSYLDVDDPAVHGDSVNLEVYLRDVIRSTQALLVISTPNTRESWWVPFEIGVAREIGKVLSSRVDKRDGVPLPSYLAAWPVITSDAKLKEWAADFIEYPISKYDVDKVLGYFRVRYRYV